MFDFKTISKSDCPLISPEPEDQRVIDLYNLRTRQFALVQQEFPDLLTDRDIAIAAAELVKIRNKLTRRRYQVGFIGPFQIGKSSTFNNLAGVRPEDAPSPEGGVGAAASSTINRVFAASGTEHNLTLTYLSIPQFQAKRAALCKATGFDDETLTDEQILAELPRRVEQFHAGHQAVALGMSDYEFLDRFLRSYKAHKNRLIKAEGFRDGKPYSNRAQFLSHDRNATTSENLLLQQAEIGLAGSSLPAELEMIDLPGLGSQGTIDTLLTEGFLNELDGALVFAKATQIGNSETEKGFAKLAQVFEGRLSARLWLVITQFDFLNKNSFYGDDRGDTIFHTISRVLSKFRLSPGRVFLISNPIYRLTRATDGEPDPVAVRGKLEQNPGDLGPDWVPPKFRAPEFNILCRAYEKSLLVDGGMGALRRLVSQDLAAAVGREICEWSRAKLAFVYDKMIDGIDRTIRRQGLNQSGVQNISLCLTKMLQVERELATKPDPFASSAKTMRDDLIKEFAKHCPDDATLESMTQPNLARLFRVNAQTLENILKRLAEQQLIPDAFKWVQCQVASLPSVPLTKAVGLAEAWQVLESIDLRTDNWWEECQFPSFLADDLFHPQLVNDPDWVFLLTGSAYRQLMEEKIWLTVHQAVHAMRNRLGSHTRDLNKELAQLVDTHAQNGSVDSAAKLRALRSEVEKLQ